MAHPQSVDYQEAVQNPQHSFIDSNLKVSVIQTNTLGLPLALSGGFALTYKATVANRRYAIRCFHKEVPSIEGRYNSISRILTSLNSKYFVYFKFISSGIVVKGNKYPIVVMEWIEGDPLGVWLDKNYNNPTALQGARRHFREMAAHLEKNGIGHGDIQNGNIMMSNQGIKLIDYDGMYVPGLPLGAGTEIGHKHFQHPKRSIKHYGPIMDRFSFIVLDLSLQALTEDSTLHRRFREGGEAIIFTKNDFVYTSSSEVFGILAGNLALSKAANQLKAICNSDINAVPSLEEFLRGENIPTGSINVNTPFSVERENDSRKYLSAFPVVDATEYELALHYVGDRIELVGRIVEVKIGIGNYGRGRSPRYVFVNFGHWRGNIIKLTFWSEALERMREQPSEAWVGRWVSVTGLLDPPYQSRRWKYSHLSISVHDDGQIQVLDEEQALFRLGKRTWPNRIRLAPAPRPQTNGAQKATGLNSGVINGAASYQKVAVSGGSLPISKNQEVVRKFTTGSPAAMQGQSIGHNVQTKSSGTSALGSRQTRANATSVSDSIRSLLHRFGWRPWVIMLFGLLFLLGRTGEWLDTSTPVASKYFQLASSNQRQPEPPGTTEADRQPPLSELPRMSPVDTIQPVPESSPLPMNIQTQSSATKGREEPRMLSSESAGTAIKENAVSQPSSAAHDYDPNPEIIKKFAFSYMRQLSQQKLSDREIANQLASTIIWLEKLQSTCPSYYYVNARRTRFDYLLRQGAWAMMFGPGKTSTSIMNEASAKRNQEFNNSVSKKEWCEGIKALGIKTFGWAPLFEIDQ
jgi:hypothetical protein